MKLFQITSQVAVCGQPMPDEELIDKTLSTFHATNFILAIQYRNMKFIKYLELIAYMLLAEKHQLLLLDNRKTRPPRNAPLPQKNESHFNARNAQQTTWRGHGAFRRRGGRFAGIIEEEAIKTEIINNQNNWWRRRSFFQGKKCGRGGTFQPTRDKGTNPTECFRCGTLGHIKNECQTPIYLAKLY
jgi:hypothetical protein